MSPIFYWISNLIPTLCFYVDNHVQRNIIMLLIASFYNHLVSLDGKKTPLSDWVRLATVALESYDMRRCEKQA